MFLLMNVRCVSTSSGDSFFVAGVQSALKSILIKLSEITQLSMFVYLPSLCIITVYILLCVNFCSRVCLLQCKNYDTIFALQN